MNMQNKQPITYEVLSHLGELIAIGLLHREGRMPITRTTVNAYGMVEIVCKDGQVEVMGSPDAPCPENVINRLRSHHEGLLVVEFPRLEGEAKPIPVCEQLLKANLL